MGKRDDFCGRSAVVLGASQPGSMGAATAQMLIDRGARVLIAARRGEQVAALAQRIGADALACDITAEPEVERLAARARELYGKLDFAVNTVGQAVMGDIANTSMDDLRRAIDVHLVGTFLFFKHMQAAIGEDGAMVTVSSLTARRVINNHAAYTASKAGGDHLVRIAALEFAPRRIRVNAVSPGFTVTPMSEDFVKLDGLTGLFEREIPLGRLNTAQDVAHAICWLCDPATFVTGENIDVNGGHQLTRMPAKREFVELVKGKTR